MNFCRGDANPKQSNETLEKDKTAHQSNHDTRQKLAHQDLEKLTMLDLYFR